MITVILIILIVFFLAGAVPVYGSNPSYGYGFGGLGGILIILLLVLLLLGKL